MARAIKLATLGQYSTSPNPNVGCVIVNNNEIVGEGYHKFAGDPHAEVNALFQAGDKAKGATVFVTLEPCAHYGKTGPCAEALVKADVAKVIIANTDPNPLVAGKGIAILENAGIEVHTGVLNDAASQLNTGFFRRMQHDLPFVTVKLAASLDGKTALANGQSQWITSAQSRLDVHRERAKQCAILTGADTVIADNPKMTVRLDDGDSAVANAYQQRAKPIQRIIVDGKNRLTGKERIFDDDAPTLVLNLSSNHRLPATTEQWQIDAENAYVNLKSALLRLAKDRQVNNLWVEAGGNLSGAFVQQNLVDRLVLYQAPVFLGDKGRDLLNMNEIKQLENAKRAQLLKHVRIGPDIKLELGFT
ncbi:MAG: bifunctional diaminohydroxyphosphoribosylaminopyrimidine deaminase/5-amino-6-(5-phosphoribosylamino)uracil reductase RibD [Pseudomonadota bacterium]